MRMLQTAGLFAALGVGVPALAAAQDACGDLLKAPAVGGWGEYLVDVPAGDDLKVRFAVVGQETRADKQLVWFEMRVDGGQGRMVSQVLVPGYPHASAAIEDVVLQPPRRAPIRLSGLLLDRARKSPSRLSQSIADGCGSAKLVGEERITVPAGTFSAKHYRNAERNSDIWVAAGVPFGVVKMTDQTDSTSFELTASGKDAKSSVTAEPTVRSGGPS